MQRPLDEVRDRIRLRKIVTDFEFDRWMMDDVRCHSARHWTPVGVAARVAGWLHERGVSRVLDVGSGVGKFCVVGALATPLSFVGIEHRRHLVDAARALARRFQVDTSTRFIHGSLNARTALSCDALYLYNPFEENLHGTGMQIDQTVALGRPEFLQSIRLAQSLMERMAPHSYLVTYNGFGGSIPGSYVLEEERAAGVNLLRLWRKEKGESPDGFWIELDDQTVFFRHRFTSCPVPAVVEARGPRRVRRVVHQGRSHPLLSLATSRHRTLPR
jgi:SAM-dependent methyltransferase